MRHPQSLGETTLLQYHRYVHHSLTTLILSPDPPKSLLCLCFHQPCQFVQLCNIKYITTHLPQYSTLFTQPAAMDFTPVAGPLCPPHRSSPGKAILEHLPPSPLFQTLAIHFILRYGEKYPPPPFCLNTRCRYLIFFFFSEDILSLCWWAARRSMRFTLGTSCS